MEKIIGVVAIVVESKTSYTTPHKLHESNVPSLQFRDICAWTADTHSLQDLPITVTGSITLMTSGTGAPGSGLRHP